MLLAVSVQIWAVINLSTKNSMWHRCKKSYKKYNRLRFLQYFWNQNLKFSVVVNYKMQMLAKNGLKKIKVLKSFIFKMTK